MKLEELQPNAAVRGILPDAFVTVVALNGLGRRRSISPTKTRRDD